MTPNQRWRAGFEKLSTERLSDLLDTFKLLHEIVMDVLADRLEDARETVQELEELIEG